MSWWIKGANECARSAESEWRHLHPRVNHHLADHQAKVPIKVLNALIRENEKLRKRLAEIETEGGLK